MSSPYHEVSAGFGADANPVHAVGRLDRPIGLDADFEITGMQRIDEGLIHLQQWLAAGQYRVTVYARSGPLRGGVLPVLRLQSLERPRAGPRRGDVPVLRHRFCRNRRHAWQGQKDFLEDRKSTRLNSS